MRKILLGRKTKKRKNKLKGILDEEKILIPSKKQIVVLAKKGEIEKAIKLILKLDWEETRELSKVLGAYYKSTVKEKKEIAKKLIEGIVNINKEKIKKGFAEDGNKLIIKGARERKISYIIEGLIHGGNIKAEEERVNVLKILIRENIIGTEINDEKKRYEIFEFIHEYFRDELKEMIFNTNEGMGVIHIIADGTKDLKMLKKIYKMYGKEILYQLTEEGSSIFDVAAKGSGDYKEMEKRISILSWLMSINFNILIGFKRGVYWNPDVDKEVKEYINKLLSEVDEEKARREIEKNAIEWIKNMKPGERVKWFEYADRNLDSRDKKRGKSLRK